MNLLKSLFFCICLSTTIQMNVAGQELNDFEKWLADASSLKATDVRKAVNEFKSEVKDLNEKYSNAFNERRAKLSDSLEAARIEATKTDKLDTAIQIRDLQRLLEKVPALPANLDVKVQPKRDSERGIAEVVGKWQGKWGTTGNDCNLSISDTGNLIHLSNNNKRRQLVLQNGKMLSMDASMAEDIEIVPSGDRIIVLAWSRYKKLNPLVDQPNHIAILRRMDGRDNR